MSFLLPHPDCTVKLSLLRRRQVHYYLERSPAASYATRNFNVASWKEPSTFPKNSLAIHNTWNVRTCHSIYYDLIVFPSGIFSAHRLMRVLIKFRESKPTTHRTKWLQTYFCYLEGAREPKSFYNSLSVSMVEPHCLPHVQLIGNDTRQLLEAHFLYSPRIPAYCSRNSKYS